MYNERWAKRCHELRQHGFTLREIARDLVISEREVQAYLARALKEEPAAAVVPLRARKLTGKDKIVAKHLERAAGEHQALAGSHDTIDDYIDAARSAHKRLVATLKHVGGKQRAARTTSTLAELGYDHHKVTRDVEALGEALEVFAQGHAGAVRSAKRAAEAIDNAQSALKSD